MISFFYHIALFLFAIGNLPKILWQWAVLGKYRESLGQRLGFSIPQITASKKKSIWIHAISMGETRAVVPLFHKIRTAFPDLPIVISSTTETGHAEAKRSMPDAAAHFFLPLDFSWIIRRLLHRVNPAALILCESDFWYHLLTLAKEEGVSTFLVNGKISERSCLRFQKLLPFAKRLFGAIDHFYLQSERFYDRFLSLKVPAEKLTVTGNLKFDAAPREMSEREKEEFRQQLCIDPAVPVLVVGSTHAPEEEWILSALDSIWRKIPQLKVLLVPRHPERFAEVSQKIEARGISFARYSEGKKQPAQLILIDAMGLLNHCYQLATIAIVGGSFVSHVGGHNIFEPVLFGVPVLFGPHMHSQLDFVDLVLQAQAGIQTQIDGLPTELMRLLEKSDFHRKMQQNCLVLARSVPGAAQRTFAEIEKKIKSVEL